MPRIRPLKDPVTVWLDGEAVVAERGEPLAVALVAAGHRVLARSPKFHRPRGPACLRGACDGCLARVDEVPNVMTCRVPTTDGLRVETQNVLGSRDLDLLRVTDWFFPEGMNHHELWVGVPGAQRVTQAMARRVAGLGKLPTRAFETRTASRRAVDALVVGAGPSGMAAAVELMARGRAVEIVDDDLAWGGCLQGMTGEAAGRWAPAVSAFAEALARGVVLRLGSSVLGVYGDDALVAGAEGVEVLTTRTLVLAPGAHDGVLGFEGNDLPGVMSTRAGGRLLALGVTPGRRVVVLTEGQPSPFAVAYLRGGPDALLVRGAPLAARGARTVSGLTVATADGTEHLSCDTILVDAPCAPAYELCVQAGAELNHQPYGFAVLTGPGGLIRKGVFAVGEAVGTPLEPSAIQEEARALAVSA